MFFFYLNFIICHHSPSWITNHWSIYLFILKTPNFYRFWCRSHHNRLYISSFPFRFPYLSPLLHRRHLLSLLGYSWNVVWSISIPHSLSALLWTEIWDPFCGTVQNTLLSCSYPNWRLSFVSSHIHLSPHWAQTNTRIPYFRLHRSISKWIYPNPLSFFLIPPLIFLQSPSLFSQ